MMQTASSSSSAADGEVAYLCVKGLSKVYTTHGGPVRALEQVSVEARRGEFLSVLGPSGCGKSTLLMIAAGLLRPSSGAVSIDGALVTEPRTDIGIVFQNPVLLEWRTALGNVMLQAEAKRLERTTARRRAFELLMDEPFGALDALTRDQLVIDLQQIWNERRMTVLFVTHSVPEAVFLSDRVMVMTPRPGRVDRMIKIELPRPRTLAMRETPEFASYVREILDLFLARGILREH